MAKDLTVGSVPGTMLRFSGPMILGNLLQQCYNIADTLIVGRVLGAEALAAVGSAYTLMTFLTSVLIGLCMGSSSVCSFYYGKKEPRAMGESILAGLILIGTASVLMNAAVFVGLDGILSLLRVPEALYGMMREYVWVIFWGIFFVFLYNYYAFLLRAAGDSVTPLWFLGGASVLNIVLDLWFVMVLNQGIKGAALATVIAQGVSGVGIVFYTWYKEPDLWPGLKLMRGAFMRMGETARFSAAAVKIDSFAYMPAQEFGNAFSFFISQNQGAGKKERTVLGVRSAVMISAGFCLAVSVLIFCFAPYLMQIFINAGETEIIRVGVGYLRVEGSFYCGIGILFLLYGYYRGIGKPEMSVVLTVISLGTRVLLAYMLAPIPAVGVWGIWWAIPIGWILADMTGFIVMRRL